MSDVTHIVNDQRSSNETSKSFDSNESVTNRSRPLINTSERQFVSQEPINPAPRFRPADSNQFQLWRQPPPSGRPPLVYPPNRFPPRNVNEPRPVFPSARTIPPLRTQEFQNRRSFEKPERPYDVELSQVENRIRPNSPWQRIRERLPLQSAEHPNDMESTQMKISAFEDAMNREMNKDRIPPFRRDSIVNADSRLKPQPEKRFADEDDPSRKNRPAELSLNPQNDLRKQSIISGEFPRRDGPDPRIFDSNSQHRPSLTQLQMNEQNYNDRTQQNTSSKARPLQAVPEYENRNYITRNDDERLREDQNRNYRQDNYGDYRKFGDIENTVNKENRKFARPEDFSQRSFDNARETFSNRYDADMNYQSGRNKNEIPFNRIDVNGVNDKNALTKDKHLANDNKTALDKKPTANGDIKPPSSLPELKKEKSALKTPTKKISPKSPEIGSANSLGDKKKVPMNKVQVGAAPSPNLKVVRSKIGSLENYTHRPGGGKVKIENRKLEWKVQPKIEAKNDKYAPSGGDKKITQVKLQWSAKSKIGSLENATHKPGGGDKKIESVKLDFKDKAKPKVGSKDNIKHVPGGGTVKKTTDVDAKSTSSNIEEQKLDIKAQSKVGSLDNVKHKPGGGDKKIFDDKEYLKQTTLTNENSKANSVTTSGSQAPEDSQITARDSQQKEKQPVAADAITSKKSDKLAKDQVKPKHEPTNESSKNDKKSQPSTPKRTFCAETKPTSLCTSASNKLPSLEKISQKSDTKTDQKLKPEAMPQFKPELKKIPSAEKIKTDVSIKSKVPIAHTRELLKTPSKEKISFKDSKIPTTQQMQKPILEPVSKSVEKRIQDKSASDSENSSEKESKLSKKEVPKNENNNVKIAAINKLNEKSSADVQVSKNESNLATKPPVEAIIMKKLDSQPKILDSDKKLPVEVVSKEQDSQPKIEPKSNLDTSKKPSVEVISKEQHSEPKIEPKSNLDTDKKPPVDVIILKKEDSQPKIESKSNLDIDRKPLVEVISKEQDSQPKIESKSNIDADKKPPVEVIILKKDSIPKVEPKSNADTVKTEEKRESNGQEIKFTGVENGLKSSATNVSTKEQIQSVKSIDLNKSTANTNTEHLNKESTNQNLKSTTEDKTNENKDQQSKLTSPVQKRNSSATSKSSLETSSIQAEKTNPTENKLSEVDEQTKPSNDPNCKLDDEKSKSMKIDNNQNDIVQDKKPISEKIPQPEIKQTSETFSPILKSDTESKPSVATFDRKSISESKPTNVPVPDVKSLPSSEAVNESKIFTQVAKNEPSKPPKNKISDTSSSVVSQNPPVPFNASSTSESKQ